MKVGPEAVMRVERDVAGHPSKVRHHSFFHGPARQRVYSTLYEPDGRARAGLLLCPGWGHEARGLTRWTHALAHDLASDGIATALLQWPGTEDSEDDLASVDIDRLVSAAADTMAASGKRCDVQFSAVMGVRFGAAPAAITANAIAARLLVLVQPALDPVAHFEEVERASRRAQLGGAAPRSWAFGYPNPDSLRHPENARRVTAALDAFTGQGTVIRYRRPAGDAAPNGFDTVDVAGDWRRPPRPDHSPLRNATRRWIRRSLAGGP